VSDGAKPLLTLEDIRVRYGGIEAVKGVSMRVDEGEMVTLIGGNGAGKSTTLKAISGVKRPSAGVIKFRGMRIDNMAAHEIVALGISQAPEGRKIFGGMTVRENLEMGAYGRKDVRGIREDFERVYTLFPLLRERDKQAGGTLSGGQQQMLAIARALLNDNRLLLIDEPTKGLSPLLVTEVALAIERVSELATVLLVEQNLSVVQRVARDAVVLDTGRVVHIGPAPELLDDKPMVHRMLGVG
jgi:branched-chain amino acid transport system ATP-binding protein